VRLCDIDTFIGLRFIQAVGSCAAFYRNGSDLFPVKKFKSTLFADVSCRAFANVSTYYWRLRNSGLWMARCFLNFGIGIVVLLASHFGFTIHEPDTSISLKPKPLFLIFG
jgi:DHA1 family bicyclomycin/chloramphenicol resistance-like MFS transporter